MVGILGLGMGFTPGLHPDLELGIWRLRSFGIERAAQNWQKGAMDDMQIYLIGGTLLAAMIGLLIGVGKGRGLMGFCLGLLLGPIGWVIVLCLSNVSRKCPHCGGGMPAGNFTRCRHCGQNLPQAMRPPGKRQRR